MELCVNGTLTDKPFSQSINRSLGECVILIYIDGTLVLEWTLSIPQSYSMPSVLMRSMQYEPITTTQYITPTALHLTNTEINSKFKLLTINEVSCLQHGI